MADRDLRLRVIFGAIDRLTAPIRRLQEGARGLSGDIRKTTGELAGLRKAQVRIAQYRAHEEQLRKTAADMAAAAGKTAGLRAELERVAQPTAKMTAALEKAERREGMLTSKHDREIAKLKEMTLALETAGHGVDDLAAHEKRLAEQTEAATRRLEAQRTRAARLEAHRQRGEKLKEIGGKVAGAGAIGSLAVTTPVVALIGASIGAAKESAAAAAQVQASLTSMGTAAGRTLDQLSAQAGRLQDTSLLDDDDIMRQVTANLLTYGKIHGAVFDQAQQAVVDLSAKTGKDLLSATTMIGKALNDPVKGLTALTRVGVAFDDQQREQIKKMAKAGNVAGAQAIMLAELKKEFAGSAAAMRAASPDGRMQQGWRTFQENVGAVALNVLPPLIERAARLLELFNALDPSVQTFLIGAVALTAGLFPLLSVIGSIMTIVGGVSTAFSIGFMPAIGIILLVVAAVAALAYGAYQIYQHWGPIKAWFSALWDGIVAGVTAAVQWIKALFANGLGGLVEAIFSLGLKLQAALWSALWAAIVWVVPRIPGAVMMIIRALVAVISGSVSLVVGAARLLLQGVLWLFRGWGTLFADAGRWLVQGLIGGITSRLSAVKDAVGRLGHAAVEKIRNVLGIHSPSRVFAAIGGHMTTGLARGIDGGAGHPVSRIAALGTRLTGAAAFGAASVGVAGASSVAARGTTIHVHKIVVNAQPGQDGRALAHQIHDELTRIGRTRRDSSYEDTD